MDLKDLLMFHVEVCKALRLLLSAKNFLINQINFLSLMVINRLLDNNFHDFLCTLENIFSIHSCIYLKG